MRVLLVLLVLIIASPAMAQVGDPTAPNAVTGDLQAMIAASMPIDGTPTQQNEGWALAMWHYAENITRAANAKADGGVAAITGVMSTYARAIMRDAVLLLLSVEIVVMLLSDGAANPIGHVIRRMLRYAVVLTLMGSQGFYQEHVSAPIAGTVTDLTNQMTNALGGQTFAGAAAFDNPYNNAFKAVWTVVKTTPIGDGIVKAFFIFVLCALAFLVIALALALAFVTWLAAGLSMKIAFAIGPLFLAFALIPATKGFADAWLGVVGTAAVGQMLSVVIISLIGFSDDLTVSSYLTGATGPGNNPVTGVQAIVAMGIVSFVLGVFVFFEVPRMAARLFHGIVASAAPYTAGLAAAFGTAAMSGSAIRGAMSGFASRAGAISSGGGGVGGSPAYAFAGVARGGHYSP